MNNKYMTLVKAVVAGVLCLTAQLSAAPKIKFEQTMYDFGKTSQVDTVTGVFKFKNVGDEVLKLEQPKPTCGCTVVEFKSDTLKPGESGELPFTMNLGQFRTVLEKHIIVKSNDPQTPEISLGLKVDYTPLYELSPVSLTPNLAFGVDQVEQSTTITRTDGKPLKIQRLDTSKSWVKATLEPGLAADATSARINIEVKRDGPARRFNEFVMVYAADKTNTPVANIYLHGQVGGELALAPEALYWSVAGKSTAPVPEAAIVRRLKISSASGQALQVKNVQSSIPGMKVELVEQEKGKAYELVARLNEMPKATISGNVSFETSLASQGRVEVPVIVNVFNQ